MSEALKGRIIDGTGAIAPVRRHASDSFRVRGNIDRVDHRVEVDTDPPGGPDRSYHIGSPGSKSLQ